MDDRSPYLKSYKVKFKMFMILGHKTYYNHLKYEQARQIEIGMLKELWCELCGLT